MLYKEIPQIRIVRASTPEEFEIKFNSEMLEMANRGYRPKVDYDLQSLTAFIHYTEDVKIPQTYAEERELMGERLRCGDCSHLIRTDDRRVKNMRCECDGSSFHRIDTPACERYEEGGKNDKRERNQSEDYRARANY